MFSPLSTYFNRRNDHPSFIHYYALFARRIVLSPLPLLLLLLLLVLFNLEMIAGRLNRILGNGGRGGFVFESNLEGGESPLMRLKRIFARILSVKERGERVSGVSGVAFFRDKSYGTGWADNFVFFFSPFLRSVVVRFFTGRNAITPFPPLTLSRSPRG